MGAFGPINSATAPHPPVGLCNSEKKYSKMIVKYLADPGGYTATSPVMTIAYLPSQERD